jgi:hypothetical protein
VQAQFSAFRKFHSVSDAVKHFELHLKETPSSLEKADVTDELLTKIAASLTDVYDIHGTSNEATKFVERILEKVTIPVCKKVKVPLQLQITGSRSNGFLNLALIGQGKFAHPVTTTIETKASSTMQKGCTQCMAQMASLVDWNTTRGYHFDQVYGIVTNQQNWQFLKFTTETRVTETSDIYTFPSPIAQADAHFTLDQLKNSDAVTIIGIISRFIDWSVTAVRDVTTDEFQKRMWENDAQYNRNYCCTLD